MGSPVRPLPSTPDDVAFQAWKAQQSSTPKPIPLASQQALQTTPDNAAFQAWKAKNSATPQPQGSIADVIAHGASFGMGQNLSALERTITDPTSYQGHFWDNFKTAHESELAKVANYHAAHPGLAAATEAASGAIPAAIGALATGGGSAIAEGAADAMPLTFLKRVYLGAATGGAAQGAQTAIDTPGTPLDRLKAVGNTPPWQGMLVGGAIPAAGSLLNTLIDRATPGAAGASHANNVMIERLRQAKMTPQDLGAAARDVPDNAPIVAADLMGQAGRKLVRWTTDQPSLAGNDLTQQLQSRTPGQMDRTIGNMKDAMGQDFVSVPATRDQLIAQMKSNAKPLYDAALPQPVSQGLTQEVRQLGTDFPEFKKAFERGQELRGGDQALDAQAQRASGNPIPAPPTPAQAEGAKTLAYVQKVYGDDPVMLSSVKQQLGLSALADEQVPLTVGDIHYTKLGLDDLINHYAQRGGVAPNRARQLQTALGTLLDQMQGEVPAYGKARSIYHSDANMVNALDLGQKALHLPVDDLKAATSEYTPGEWSAFRTSAMGAMKDAAGNVDTRNDLMKRWISNPNMEARLRLIAPTDAAANQMLAHRDLERTMSMTNAAPTAGSNTSTNMADQPNGSGSLMSTAFVAPISWHRAAIQAARAVGRAVHLNSNTVLSESLGPMLGADKSDIPALVARLTKGKQELVRKAITEQILAAQAGSARGANPQP